MPNCTHATAVNESFWSVLYGLPELILGLLLVMVIFAAHGAGQWARRHFSSFAETQRLDGFAPAPPVVSSILGLLTLLISFTFSMAVGGYDKRYDAVVDEARAVYATDLAARLVGTSADGFRSMLKQYVDLRLAAATTPDFQRTRELTKESTAMQRRLWNAANFISAAAPGDQTSKLIASTQTMVEVGMRRVALRQPVVPIRVLFTVILFTIVSAFVLGYSYRGVTHRASAALLLLLTLVVVLIIDIEKPSGGAIRESQQPMQDVHDRLYAA